ncbi:tyrosine-type recombinase/integrase [Rhodopseudomonas sp. P2A-2r]|uniref:tyrosine-type recombinase/integrase n=1 Tax=unclassified Rhodopseudomonas TaxID=2638247 RepID=UPI0039B6ED48
MLPSKRSKRLPSLAGIPEADKISPKTLRHAFGAHLLQNGADPSSVHAMLGHAVMGSMEMYVEAMSSRRDTESSVRPPSWDLGRSRIDPHQFNP